MHFSPDIQVLKVRLPRRQVLVRHHVVANRRVFRLVLLAFQRKTDLGHLFCSKRRLLSLIGIKRGGSTSTRATVTQNAQQRDQVGEEKVAAGILTPLNAAAHSRRSL